MIDFLKEYDIKEVTIKKMNEIYSSSFLFDLNCNEVECGKIIIFLKSIGIENIDILLLYEIGLFFKNMKKIEFAFSKFNIYELVEQINHDYTVLEQLYSY